MDDVVTHTTKDFNLAAFLWCQPNTNLVNAAPQEPSRPSELYFTFSFKNCIEEEVNTLILKYFNRNCSVEPSAFVSAQARLKHIIHSH